jgi:hypothetical protein
MFSGATLDLGGTMGMHLGIERPDSSPLTPLQRPRAGEIRRGGLETIVCAPASTTRIMKRPADDPRSRAYERFPRRPTV